MATVKDILKQLQSQYKEYARLMESEDRERLKEAIKAAVAKAKQLKALDREVIFHKSNSEEQDKEISNDNIIVLEDDEPQSSESAPERPQKTEAGAGDKDPCENDVTADQWMKENGYSPSPLSASGRFTINNVQGKYAELAAIRNRIIAAGQQIRLAKDFYESINNMTNTVNQSRGRQQATALDNATTLINNRNNYQSIDSTVANCIADCKEYIRVYDEIQTLLDDITKFKETLYEQYQLYRTNKQVRCESTEESWKDAIAACTPIIDELNNKPNNVRNTYFEAQERVNKEGTFISLSAIDNALTSLQQNVTMVAISMRILAPVDVPSEILKLGAVSSPIEHRTGEIILDIPIKFLKGKKGEKNIKIINDYLSNFQIRIEQDNKGRLVHKGMNMGAFARQPPENSRICLSYVKK